MARPAMQRELNVSFSGSKKMQRVNQSKFDAVLAVFHAADQMRVENAKTLAKTLGVNLGAAVVQTAGRGYDFIVEMTFVTWYVETTMRIVQSRA
jgi:hypothetical protein